MEITENMLLQFDNEDVVRIIHCNRLSSIIYAIPINKVVWPLMINKEELYSGINDGTVRVLDDDKYLRIVQEDELSIAQKNKREERWKLICEVYKQLESDELIFDSKYRNQAIQITRRAYAVSYNTIKNYLIQYWQNGKIKNGLLPNYHLCGAKGRERINGTKKRGRPRKEELNIGVNIDDAIKRYFQIGLNRYYYNERQNSLKTVYELIIKEFFTEKAIDYKGKEIPVIKDYFRLPTYNQFLYWYKKFNDPKKELIKRKGTRNYFQNHRTIIGDSTQDAGIGPGTLWQIDSTPFDIYLVSSINRNLIVGRPTVYLVIDIYSRMIVGCNISMESFNSYTGAMVALANSMSSKLEYCKQYGISLDQEQWDVACIPQRIFADRGELNGKQIEDAIASLGISIQNAPPYRADYKGVIEQAFEQLNLKIKPFADGVVRDSKRINERGASDYRLKANLTIDEFTKIIIKCILYHNNHHVLNQYVLDEVMLQEEVEKIPNKIWKHGLKTMKGQLRTLPEETIKMHLLPTDIASVTARGVKFKKMLYASDYTLKNNWFQEARVNGTRKVKVWFDSRDLSYIYVVNENDEFHRLLLLDHLTKFKGKSMEEIDKIIEFEGIVDKKSKSNELQEKVKLFDEIETIVEEGRKATVAEVDESLSKTQRLNGIKDNKKDERELQRERIKKKVNASKEKEIYIVTETEEVQNEWDIFKM